MTPGFCLGPSNPNSVDCSAIAKNKTTTAMVGQIVVHQPSFAEHRSPQNLKTFVLQQGSGPDPSETFRMKRLKELDVRSCAISVKELISLFRLPLLCRKVAIEHKTPAVEIRIINPPL